MNIFLLDEHPQRNARYLANKHLGKQLYDIMRVLASTSDPRYTLSVPKTNGIFVEWANVCEANRIFLLQLAREICWEYRRRLGHFPHQMPKLDKIPSCYWLNPLSQVALSDFSTYPQLVPAQYKHPSDPVLAYRLFYVIAKRKMLDWPYLNEIQQSPYWWPDDRKLAEWDFEAIKAYLIRMRKYPLS